MEQNTTEPESDSSSVVPTEDAVESEPNNGEPEGIRAGPSSSEPPVVNSDACDAMPPAQPNDSDAGINKDVAINSSEVVDEAAIDLSMEDPVPASAPMEDSLPASAPMEDSLPASAPMEDPVPASAPMEDPVPASAPVEDPVPASASVEDPVSTPAAMTGSIIPANEDEEEEPFFSLPSPLIQALIILWLLWLFVGTCFYAYELNMGWATGFYMAVNIGYSIGWGDFSEGPGSQWFSIFYVLCGSSFVAAALGIFANSIVSDRSNWYENQLLQLAHDEAMAGNDLSLKLEKCLTTHWTKLRSIVLFLVFVFTAAFCAWQNTKFTFREALYFAVSSLSTGGHYALPSGQDDWVYGMTGFYAALGVPVMGVAMGTMAGFFIASGTVEETLFEIRKPVNRREVKMLTEFEIENGDGEIDKSEFIILCMVRIGAASPDLIKLIMEYFNELDEDGSGALSLEEICHKIEKTSKGNSFSNSHERIRDQARAQFSKMFSSHSSDLATDATTDSSSQSPAALPETRAKSTSADGDIEMALKHQKKQDELYALAKAAKYAAKAAKAAKGNNGKGDTELDEDDIEEIIAKKDPNEVLYYYLFALWLLWLFVGTCFYAYELNMGWATGFYMAVNIGYSIGWGDFSEGPSSQWFSIFYVICGSSFVAAALGIFANNIISESGRWYENELKQVAFDHVMAKPDHYPLKLKTFVMFHWTKLRTVLLFTSFILIATLCAWQNTKFTFREALYFAVASLSTGGHYALPSGQDDWVYGMTGFYAALGVPVMGIAMGTIAGLLITGDSIEDTLAQIKTEVKPHEVRLMTEFGIANDDGDIDKAEFIILCMLRIGAASPELIQLIIGYFIELDDDNSGTLSLDELCQKVSASDINVSTQRAKVQARRYSAVPMAPVKGPNSPPYSSTGI